MFNSNSLWSCSLPSGRHCQNDYMPSATCLKLANVYFLIYSLKYTFMVYSCFNICICKEKRKLTYYIVLKDLYFRFPGLAEYNWFVNLHVFLLFFWSLASFCLTLSLLPPYLPLSSSSHLGCVYFLICI